MISLSRLNARKFCDAVHKIVSSCSAKTKKIVLIEKVYLPSLLPPSHGAAPSLLYSSLSLLDRPAGLKVQRRLRLKKGLKEGKAFAASDPRFERAASFTTFVVCMGAG